MEHASEISWDSDREWSPEDMLREEVFEDILDEVDDSLDQSNVINVIEEIKNRLEHCEEWKEEYEKWKKNGFNINHYFERGTLLHQAVDSGFHNLVKALVANGADPNIVNLNGHTPLSLAAKEEQKEILSSLLKADNVNVNTTIESGSTTLLHLAVWFLSGEETLETLLVLGANIDAVDDQKRTPLLIPAEILETSYNGKRFTEYSKVLIKYSVLHDPEAVKLSYIANNPGLSEHWDRYRGEVRKMQNDKLGNSNVSLRQFLSETNPSKLADYLSNANTGVREALKKGENIERWKNAYPLYANEIKSIIQSQYNKGMDRKNLLNKGAQVLQHCVAENNIYSLKDLCTAKINGNTLISRMPVPEDQSREAIKAIASRLSDVDMENFIRSTGPKTA